MTALLKDILACLNTRYPAAWAAPGDRVGLQVGDPGTPVDMLLVALEASPAVVEQARSLGAQALLTHHPLIYQPLTEVRQDRPGGRLLAQVLRAGLAVLACHTNLDVAPGGLNDYLAQLLGLPEAGVLAPALQEKWFKLAVFIPLGSEDRVRQAVFAEPGAGVIGRYSHCSFAARGQGTYLPLAGAQPFRGEIAHLARPEESRLEVLVPESRLEAAVAGMKAAHPYEEVAYDLYPLANPGPSLGFGRIGNFPQSLSFSKLITKVKEIFGVERVQVWGRPPEKVGRLAVCGGSGGEFIAAARAQGAQAYLTGEVRHHQAVPGDLEGFAILTVGHFRSEVVFMPEWARRLEQLFQEQGLAVQVQAATQEAAPCHYL